MEIRRTSKIVTMTVEEVKIKLTKVPTLAVIPLIYTLNHSRRMIVKYKYPAVARISKNK